MLAGELALGCEARSRPWCTSISAKPACRNRTRVFASQNSTPLPASLRPGLGARWSINNGAGAPRLSAKSSNVQKGKICLAQFSENFYHHGWEKTTPKPAPIDLNHRLQAPGLHQMQQFERGAGGALLANFPLLHGGDAGVEQRGKHGLADVCCFADGFDLPRIQRRDGRQA